MKLDSLKRRIEALEPEPGKDCPHCKALASMTKEEMDQDIRELKAGGPGRLAGIESSPLCHHCQRAAAMSEEELDAELARLSDILKRCGYAELDL